MSGYEQGGEAPSAGAAAASASTAGEEQQSKQRALEEKIRELAEKIKEVETEIAADKTEVKSIKNEKERVELRRAIAANSERLQGLEARRDRLEVQIEQLSTPATAACGRFPTSCLLLRWLIGLPRRALRALVLLREFDSPFHLCARTATRPTRRFARVVRSPSVRVHHPSLCIDSVALSLPHRVCAASHLVHAPRGAADCGTWTLSYLVPTLALAHRLACLAGYCARSSCYENLTALSTCAHNPCTGIWPRNHALLFGGLALSSCSARSPVPKGVWRLHPCVPLPPTFTRTLLCSSGVRRHQAASSTVICAHALPFRYALLRRAALIRHKSCLALPPRRRIVTYPCPRLVDYMLYRVPAASITELR
jgi:hypothetical protein